MIQLLAGDCRDVLPTLAADSVQCVVTSPPYYGLRDYGTALWAGGDAACDHKPPPRTTTERLHDTDTSGFRGADHGTLGTPYRDTCGKCGATRIDRQIGLEATPDEYLATMVAVFREVRRVMRNDAVAFINMGDSYSDKQLLMMPARLALALQADGWWLRSAIVWAKPNPMPESVTDRPTSAYEMVYLLTKRSRYFYDAAGIAEPSLRAGDYPGGDNGRGVGEYGIAPHGPFNGTVPAMRSCRNVWTIATHAYPNAHFATYPPELAERCIRAGTSERGACSQCGAPWARVTERTFVPQPDVSLQRGIKGAAGQKPMDASNGWDGVPRGTTNATTTGWAPGCKCDAGIVPCTILDPFFGAGTTGLVSERLGRDCIGIDLNPDYNAMSRARIEADCPLFTSFPPAEPPEDERMRDLFRDAAD